MTTSEAQPLPSNSPKLKDRRYHVTISRPNTRGTFTVYHEGRFANPRDPRVWAERTRKAGERARITYYSARDGWVGHHIAMLTDDGWEV